MTGFLLLHADQAATLLADDPIVPADDVARFADVTGLLAAVSDMRRGANDAHQDAREAARAEGYAEGEAAGRAAGEAAIREEFLRLAQADAVRADAQRADLAHLALEVVRRIARDLGPDFVAGLAAKAAEEVTADSDMIVRVHPDAVEAVRERIGPQRGITITGDTSLDASDCIIETSLGRTHAGLDTQLAQLGRAWGIA